MDRMFKMDGLDCFLTPNYTTARDYPDINMRQLSTNDIMIEVSVPGFSKSDINVEFEDHTITIQGIAPIDTDKIDFIQKNIPMADFEKSVVINKKFKIGEVSANLSNGVLVILVTHKEIPVQKIKIE